MAAFGVRMLRRRASRFIAPAPLRFGPILPPCAWMVWQTRQAADNCLLCAVSPLLSASERYLASFSDWMRASWAVRTGGGSKVRTMRAEPIRRPQLVPPGKYLTRPEG